MTTVFMFPGQGSQKIGMGQDLAAAFPAAREVFEEVDEALGQKLSQMMFTGAADDLNLTENTQPALMAVSLAVWRILTGEGKMDPAAIAKFMAGHSLGEYSALTAAGSFGLADAAKLLRIRGQAMQQAVPVGQGGMAAILGLDYQDVMALSAEASSEAGGGEICVAANDNCPGQVVISGHKDAVARAMALAQEKGAKRSLALPVSAPFHSPLMQPAAEVMRKALDDVAMQKPILPIVTNVTAMAEEDPTKLKALLVDQVTGAVRWRESIEWMIANGATRFVEIGAGKVLAGLVKRINRDVETVSVETPEEIEAFLKSL